MSWLSNIGKAVGKGVKDVGHAAGSVLSNPIVDAGLAFIPGVGPVAAGAAAGLGNLIKPGGNLGAAVKGGLTTGGLSALGGLAGHIPGVQSLEGALSSIPGAGAVGNAIKGIGGAANSIPGVQGVEQFLQGQGGGALSNIASGVGNFLGGNGGKNALGVAEAANAAMLQSRQNDLAKGALATSQQSYGERAPLRAAGVQGMLNPGAGIQPRIAALTAGSSNPFQRPPAIQGVGA